jgi:hypothetical protein
MMEDDHSQLSVSEIKNGEDDVDMFNEAYKYDDDNNQVWSDTSSSSIDLTCYDNQINDVEYSSDDNNIVRSRAVSNASTGNYNSDVNVPISDCNDDVPCHDFYSDDSDSDSSYCSDSYASQEEDGDMSGGECCSNLFTDESSIYEYHFYHPTRKKW